MSLGCKYTILPLSIIITNSGVQQINGKKTVKSIKRCKLDSHNTSTMAQCVRPCLLTTVDFDTTIIFGGQIKTGLN